MKNFSPVDISITGIGVTSAIGQGKEVFFNALINGHHKFDFLRREGRQSIVNAPLEAHTAAPFLGAEIAQLIIPDSISTALLRTASWSSHVALATLDEAWKEASLNDVDPTRIGLIIGGSNFQQREILLHAERYRNKLEFIRPTYGIGFMDTDLSALCSEVFGIRGRCHTVGGASASGQLAVIQAAEAVRMGQVDVCIALGALMDLSFWELQAFKALGAMGSTRFAERPDLAARPFDSDRDGFIFGESCGALVIESAKLRPKTASYGSIRGWSVVMDANRNPNPSVAGEAQAIQQALIAAGLRAAEIDYVNPHGTGSPLGDTTELEALTEAGLRHAYINTTKSIIGHGLAAAGVVELITLLLQMRHGRLHLSRNLERPITDEFNWVGSKSIEHSMNIGLNLSMGFGGINTALCIEQMK